MVLCKIMSDDDVSAPMSVAQRIAALNIQTESAPPQPAAAASIKPKPNANALAARIAALQRNVPPATPSTSDGRANNDHNAGEGGGGGGGSHHKTEKPKVGRLKPPPAGTVPILVPFGSGPPPPSLLRKQREREERMERLQREAKSTDEVEGPAAEAEAEATRPEIIRSKLPAGVVPTMLPFGPGLPPILLKKQREREERMEEMKREARPMDNGEGGVDDGASPTTDENFDEALLLRPIVKGGKRRSKTRD
jgi:hypothetical protein